jgi:hypothetical protein
MNFSSVRIDAWISLARALIFAVIVWFLWPAANAQVARALEFVDSLWIRSGFPNPDDNRFGNKSPLSRLNNIRIEP